MERLSRVEQRSCTARHTAQTTDAGFGECSPGRFPPQCAEDIASYDTDDVVTGYREHRLDDPSPGDNHPPGYCWGWTNARKDVTLAEDGYEPLRHAYIQMQDNLN